MKRIKVLGICCANGVMLYPFRKGRYKIIANIEPRVDYKTPEDIQWQLNFPNKQLIKSYTLPEDLKPQIIIGAPTCGHSSSLAYSRGKKLGNGKKDLTINLFIEGVNKYKPKFFLFENLPNLFKSFSEKDFDLAFPDYTLIKHTASVAHYGNSQLSRIRLIIIGIRRNLPIASSIFELPPLELSRLLTVKELENKLIYPMAALCHVREDINSIVCMEHNFKKLSLKEIKKIWNAPGNETRKKWDATTTGKGNMRNLPGVYRNLPDEFPLTARKQNRQFNSEGDIMSPRELAVIQGIPLSFRIWYDPNQHQYSINKGRITATKCPPMEISRWFKSCLKQYYGKELS